MGIKGRKRRFKSFGQRAASFAADIRKGRSLTAARCKRLELDGTKLQVGTGRNRRLVAKPCDDHMRDAMRAHKGLSEFLGSRKITPRNYELVVPTGSFIAADSKGGISFSFGVQEFFHRPNLLALRAFFQARQAHGRGARQLSKEEYLLCKQLVNQYRSVTPEKANAAWAEISSHLLGAKKRGLERNIVVVGLTRQGRLRLAIVDV